jgi:hypothetical protein
MNTSTTKSTLASEDVRVLLRDEREHHGWDHVHHEHLEHAASTSTPSVTTRERA